MPATSTCMEQVEAGFLLLLDWSRISAPRQDWTQQSNTRLEWIWFYFSVMGILLMTECKQYNCTWWLAIMLRCLLIFIVFSFSFVDVLLVFCVVLFCNICVSSSKSRQWAIYLYIDSTDILYTSIYSHSHYPILNMNFSPNFILWPTVTTCYKPRHIT